MASYGTTMASHTKAELLCQALDQAGIPVASYETAGAAGHGRLIFRLADTGMGQAAVDLLERRGLKARAHKLWGEWVVTVS